MSVQSLITFITYLANGSQTRFSVPYYFISQQDLFVQGVLNGVVTNYGLNADYTIIGTPNTFGDYENGATLSFNIAPLVGTTILIARNTPKTQTVNFDDNTPFTAETFNHALDKLTLIAQEGAAGIPSGNFLGYALGPPTVGIFTPGNVYINALPDPGSNWAWVYTTANTWCDFADISLLP